MNSDDPLSSVAILVLGLLEERPMHPYEMFQTTVQRKEDRLAKFRPGTVYHTVDRLAADGMIEVHEVRQEGNRPERTVYAITDHGQAVLDDGLQRLIETNPTEYPQLYLALSEAHGLPRQRVSELLTVRLESMRADLAVLTDGLDHLAHLEIPEMFHLDIGCRIATLRTQIDWIADLVARLDDGRIEWLDDPDSPYQPPVSPTSQKVRHP